MSLGEVNFDDFYENFGENEVSRTFALGILVLMILSVTITMVNLFVAVIISDREKMVKDVFKQNLLYMAQCSQLTHNLLKNHLYLKNLIKMFYDVDALMPSEEICVSLHKMPGVKILKLRKDKSRKKIHMLPPYTAKILGPMLERIVASRSGGQLRKDTSILLRDDTIIFSE